MEGFTSLTPGSESHTIQPQIQPLYGHTRKQDMKAGAATEYDGGAQGNLRRMETGSGWCSGSSPGSSVECGLWLGEESQEEAGSGERAEDRAEGGGEFKGGFRTIIPQNG